MDIFVRFLNPILMITLGLGLGVFLARRLRVDWRLFGIGAATFVGSQVFHIPFNVWVLTPALRQSGMGLAGDSGGLPLIFTALAFGLSAGLFEETFRYLAYRFWIKETRTWREGLMFGAGHGGIEAIILGGLGLLTVVNMIVIRGTDLSAQVPPEQLELARAQVEAFWGFPWYAILLGAVERALALCFHLSAAIMVLQVFVRRNALWLGLAIGWHTLLNAAAVYSAQVWGAYISEGVLTLFALVSLWIVFKLRPTKGPADETPPGSPPALETAPIELTSEKLEDSRYA